MYQITRWLSVFFTLLSLFSYNLSHAEEREPEYLFEVKDSPEIIYVNRSAVDTFGFQVYRGVPGSLKELEVFSTTRYGDANGTTNIRLIDGSIIHVPILYDVEGVATFTSESGSVEELSRIQINDDTLDKKRIDTKNPLKAKLLTQVLTAAEINEKSNLLDVSDVKVERVFRDEAGDVIIEFRYGAESIGLNRTFWSPKGEGRLYQLYQLQGEGHSSAYEMRFLAPSESDPLRIAKINISKNGELEVSCEGGVRCFREINKLETAELENTIRRGEIELENFPHRRAIERIFQIKGAKTYIVVDSPMFNYSHDFYVNIGVKGNLKPVNVAKVSRTSTGATRIQLEDGRLITSQARSFLPHATETQYEATLTDSNGNRLLVNQGKSIEFLRDKLGMDTSRFEVPYLHTPVDNCKMFFSGS